MKIQVVSFNLRLPSRGDGINYFFNRAPYILEKIQSEKPDIIGFQEAKEPIYDWLKATLTDYVFVGLGRERDFSDEANPVAFRKDRFELFSFYQVWLSPTPEIPGSRYEEQSICPRILTAVKLKEKNGTEIIRFYNTHLDHIGAKARLLGADQILAFIERDQAESAYPVILVGDMNSLPNEPAIEAFKCHSVSLTDVTESIPCSFHGFKGGFDGEKIDYVFTHRFRTVTAPHCWAEEKNGIYYSDHYPIAVWLETQP